MRSDDAQKQSKVAAKEQTVTAFVAGSTKLIHISSSRLNQTIFWLVVRYGEGGEGRGGDRFAFIVPRYSLL